MACISDLISTIFPTSEFKKKDYKLLGLLVKYEHLKQSFFAAMDNFSTHVCPGGMFTHSEGSSLCSANLMSLTLLIVFCFDDAPDWKVLSVQTQTSD